MNYIKFMLNKRRWSYRFSWCYAFLMALAIVLFSFVLLYFNIMQMTIFRFILTVIMLGGTLLYIMDFAKHTSERIGFTKAFFHCVRTGIYTFIALVPVIIVVLLIGFPIFNTVDQTGQLNDINYQFGFMVSRFLEISSSVMLGSFLGAFVPGIIRNRKDRH